MSPLSSTEKTNGANENVQMSLIEANHPPLGIIIGGVKRDEECTEVYDPHKHRNRDHPTTNKETLIHLLKGSLGTGILAMPDAFHNAGLALGCVGTLFIGSLCTYCLHVLVRCQYKLCQKLRVPVLSYPATLQVALEQGPNCMRWMSTYASHVVNAFLVLYQLGICCVYIVFVASNIRDVANNYWQDIDVRYYMLMLLLPLIFLNYIRNLKRLAPFSILANLLTFVGLGLVLYYVFGDGGGLTGLEDRHLVGHLHGIPLFIGTTLFALEAVGVILALENNMKRPESFGGYTGVFNQAMSVIIFLYIFMGACGYLKYGNQVEGSITLNLPKDQILAQIVKLMFAIAIFITYALQCYVPVEIIWTNYLKSRFEKSPRRTYVEYAVRTTIVLVTFVLAVAVPRLELFISLFGALCLSALGLTFPAVVEFCTEWPQRPGVLLILKDAFIFAFSLLGLVVGTYISISDIVKSFL